jgi:hypothetical protein
VSKKRFTRKLSIILLCGGLIQSIAFGIWFAYSTSRGHVLASASALKLQGPEGDAQFIRVKFSSRFGIVAEYRLTEVDESSPVSKRAYWYLLPDKAGIRVRHTMKANERVEFR